MHKRLAYYRASKMPRVSVPLGARSVGHYVLDGSYAERPVRKYFVQVFWGIAGAGSLEFDGAACTLCTGEIAVYFPGDEHRVSASSDWEYRWWTMDGPLCAELVRGFGLVGPWPREAGTCPVALFEELATHIQDPDPIAEYHGTATAYRLLTEAARAGGTSASQPAAGQTLAEQCQTLIDALFTDAKLNIGSLAGRLGVHRSRLSREFRRRFGVAPAGYLQGLRLQRGFQLLRQTDKPIGEIALAAGFADAAYFSRCVSQTTGQCPRELRKTSRQR